MDDDIKIFNAKPKNDTLDSIALIEEMNTQRMNGNTEKAKQLGKYLAERFLDSAELKRSLEEEIGTLDYPPKVILQIKILMFFTAEYCINRLLPNTLLKSTATNTIYDRVMKNAGEFYKEFSDGVEYSFYYLAVKKDDVLKAVGKTFAMICRKEDDEVYKKLGSDIFRVVSKEVQSIIEGYNFINE